MGTRERGSAAIEASLRAACAAGRCALVPFLVGGRPSPREFPRVLARVAAYADVLELGVPFSDPVADGPTIAEAASAALEDGATITGLLDVLAEARLETPVVLFSYANPLLALGLDRATERLLASGVSGLVVPDLPLDSPEGESLFAACEANGLAWIQLVTPLTRPARRELLLERSRGFVYAVLRVGITGARTDPRTSDAFLAELRERSPVPVCAGFGLRDATQARVLRDHADGCIVGTALVERLERGEDPHPYLAELHSALHRQEP